MSMEIPPACAEIPELGITEQATDWLEELKHPEAGKDREATTAAFLTWLKSSPAHVREILELTTLDFLFAQLPGFEREVKSKRRRSRTKK
jgi:ferric-dicitrate binding protein FerR (iron transport regulator)